MTTTAATDQTAFAGDDQLPLPMRGDTFLGVCEAIGQDFGFNPNFLRIPLATLILWDPKIVVGIYLALGLVVAVSRFFYPVSRKAAAAAVAPVEADQVPAQAAAEALESKELLAA